MGLAYDERRDRFCRAFCVSTSSTSIVCQPCGTTYFTSAGVESLDRLRDLARESPELYVEVQDVSIPFIAIEGKQVVIGCCCGHIDQFTRFIETWPEALTDYLINFWQSRRIEFKRQTECAEAAIDRLEDSGCG